MKQKVPRYVYILSLIFVLGIFLRTYNFTQWLHFAPDQARVGILANEISTGQTSWPLLGPRAGGTDFQLGPISFWWQLASAKIFGNTPQALAYPDCLWGILTIGLFFLVWRKFFSLKITLFLTLLTATSFGLVYYSRFAWNPNATPFISLLFLLSIAEFWKNRKNPRAWLWSIGIGFSVGVGVQLHTFMLALMPIFLVLFWVYQYWKEKVFHWKHFFAILLIILTLNAGQLISEWKTQGENTKNFFTSTQKNTGANKSFFSHLGLNVWWNAKAQEFFLTSLGVEERTNASDVPHIHKALDREHLQLYLEATLWITFLLLGIYAFWKKFSRESSEKNFLGKLFLSYYLMAFFLMIPFVDKLELRFFLFLSFIPLLFLGTLLEGWEKKFPKYKMATVILVLLLVAVNLFSLYKTATILNQKRANDQDEAILGETQDLTNFLTKNIKESGYQCGYLSGYSAYVLRFYKPLEYLSEKENILLMENKKDREEKLRCPLVYIGGEERAEKQRKSFSGFEFREEKVFGNIYLGFYAPIVKN